MNEDAYTGHIQPGKFIYGQGVDPELDNLSNAEKLRLRGMGVYLDSPIPARLQREVRQRWAGYSAEYERGFHDRTVQAYYEELDLIAQVKAWRVRFKRSIVLVAAGWLAATGLVIVFVTR